MIRALLAALAVSATTSALIWWIRDRYVVVTVDGTSMEPAYLPGDRLLVRRTTYHMLRRGDVVVVTASPSQTPPFGEVRDCRWVVKRIVALAGQAVPPEVARSIPDTTVPTGHLILFGDNAATSIDSRAVGCYAGDRVLGLVLRRLGR